MRDTRKIRTGLVIALSAGLGALLGEMWLKPSLERAVGKRR